MQSIIDVFRMVEIKEEVRARIIRKLGQAIDEENGAGITFDLVKELVNHLIPNSEDKFYNAPYEYLKP